MGFYNNNIKKHIVFAEDFGANPGNTASINKQAIQNALNCKGIVRIQTAGTYLINGTLTIDSNTKFELGDNVTIKLAPSTSKYLIKNSDQVNGNVNIEINGGIWDADYTNNPATGAYPSLWGGHGIFFHKIKNLKYRNMFVQGCPKYSFLTVDCEDFVAENIRFNNPSDGLHFQPPLKKAFIRNVSGTTGDDMVAFTLGDYTNYQVSNVGNFEDILVDGVIGVNAKNLVKLTGSGLSSLYSFKRIMIQNLSGTVTNEAVFIQDDGTNLINTKIDAVTIKNVAVRGNTNPLIFLYPTGGGDLTLENIQSYENVDAIRLGVSNTSHRIDRMTVKGLRLLNSSTSNGIRIDGTVTTLTVNDMEVISGINGSAIQINGIVTKAVLNNIDLVGQSTGSGKLLGLGSVSNAPLIFINNATIRTSPYIMFLSNPNISVITINNSNFTGITTPILVNTAGGIIRLLGSGITTDKVNLNPTTQNGAVISMNNRDWLVDITKLTPTAWDTVYNTNAGATVASGLAIYDGDTLTWRRP